MEGRSLEGGNDAILFLEHPPTYTLGRRGNADNLLVSERRLRDLGAVLCRTDRGGDITFHGPGQLVGYPVFDLRKLGMRASDYVRALEEVLIRTLSVFGVHGERQPGYPGVWVKMEKVAAIGVRVNARGITGHGFALNITTDLEYFSHIVACGLKGRKVTSLARFIGSDIRMDKVRNRTVQAFGEVFDMVMTEEDAEDCRVHRAGPAGDQKERKAVFHDT